MEPAKASLLGIIRKNLSPLFGIYRLGSDLDEGECNRHYGFVFQEAMKEITQLLPEDLRKELYELWEVSIHSGIIFIVTEFYIACLCFSCSDFVTSICLIAVVLPPSCYRNFSVLIEVFLCHCLYFSHGYSTCDSSR